MRNLTVNILLSLFSLAITLLVLEGAARLYVRYVAEQPKMMTPDPNTGWIPLPNLDIKRRNSAGDLYGIRTDSASIRGESKWASGKTRILILGDSFGFGQGVDVERRFDHYFDRDRFSVINLAVNGYGTDQQIIRASDYLTDLTTGDTVLLFTYINDFSDICRHMHSGRAKPWYELKEGRLIRHRPNITVTERLRDKSYLFAKLLALLQEHETLSKEQLLSATKIYEALVIDLSKTLNRKGANLLVAFHGLQDERFDELIGYITKVERRICQKPGIHCVSLDEYLGKRQDLFLPCGHWNAQGHRVVGAVLKEKLLGFMLKKNLPSP